MREADDKLTGSRWSADRRNVNIDVIMEAPMKRAEMKPKDEDETGY